MYFNKTQTNWRISQCCQFNQKNLSKLYNVGTVSKTSALSSDGKRAVQDKALYNVNKLVSVLDSYFSKQPINLRSFRISSELLPCYTLDFTKDWYKEIMPHLLDLFSEAADIAKSNEIRLSMHPAQFTVLGSDKINVVKNSIEDIEYHALIGKLLQIKPEDYVVNIHLQGLYGGKHIDGINRFAANFSYLSDYAQKCLAVENEDKPNGYDIEHTLDLSTKIPIRCTLDIHHYECHRKDFEDSVTINNKYFLDALKTWKTVRPLFHVSQTKLDENGIEVSRKNQHSDILHDEYRLALLVPMLEYADFDIEAKFKEEAVQHCYSYIKDEEMYSGEPLICKELS